MNDLSREPIHSSPTGCPVCRQSRVSLFGLASDPDHPGKEWQIWECSDCRYGWTLPQPGPLELAAYYPSEYLGDTLRFLNAFESGALQRHRSWRRETEKVALVERYASGGRILDVGASNGAFLLALDGRRWHRMGVEFIGEVVEQVRKRHPEIDLKQGDIHSLEVEPHSLDVITFWHVFEHLYEPARVLARVAELLKPGGHLVISVPNFDSWQSHFFRQDWYAFDVPRHLHHFSPASLEKLTGEAGFELVEHTFFSLMNNTHQLRHSSIRRSRRLTGSRLPYYLIKPSLRMVQFLERFTQHRYGTLTTICRLGPA